MGKQRQVAQTTRPKTRIQKANQEKILEAALNIFSESGFRGATIDQIAEHAGMSKPNLLYYFSRKEEIYRAVLDRTLDGWLQPLREIDPAGDPVAEILGYIKRKLELARDYPRESRLFANEILQGAGMISDELRGPLKSLVDEKCLVIERWIEQGKIARHDARHLIFAIWATTQHYADFDVQVRAVLDSDSPDRFDAAEHVLTLLFGQGLRPQS